MKINQKEIFRYLGYGTKEPDETIQQLIKECVIELEKVISPKTITKTFPILLKENNEIDFGFLQTKSKHLSKNLKDCEQVILFASTLGMNVDKLIAKYSKFQMSKVVIIQAVATAMLEEYANDYCDALRREWKEKGCYLRPRFSSGYGDFSLECQKPLLEVLEAQKRIGIYLTDSLLMTPSKSITAIIGISKQPNQCKIEGCEVCQKKNCIYRRTEQ